MVLPDTSAWVELLQATDGPADRALTALLQGDAPVVVTEPVVLELLAGARSHRDLVDTRRLLLRLPMLRVGGLDTYERAAAMARVCRAGGEAIRGGLDTLITAVAIREGAAVLHRDRDFDVIARHTELRVHPLGAA